MSNKVTGTWREKVQYSTAVLAFMSGQALTWIQYLQQGEISNGVLGFVAQTLVYASSIFGIGLYIQSKFGEIRTYLKETQYERDDDNRVVEEPQEDRR